MSIYLELPETFIDDAKHFAKASNRSINKQIEYWVLLGKNAEENPELPINILRDLILSLDQVKSGKMAHYKFWRLN